MPEQSDADRRKERKKSIDALTQKRREMIEHEKANALQREEEKMSDQQQQKMAVESELQQTEGRAQQREQWRQDTHAKRREDADAKRLHEQEVKEQQEKDEEKKRIQEERDQALREFHAANVDKKVKEKIKKAEDEEQKDVAAITQRLNANVAEVRTMVERDKKHMHDQQQKKEKQLIAQAEKMRSKLSAEYEAVKKSGDGNNASEAARNRTKGMLGVDELLEKQLVDIRTETDRLQKELEHRAQEKISRLMHEADKRKMEAYKKLLSVLDWYNRDTEVIKDPMDM